MDTRVDALVQKALRSDEINTFFVDEYFARQVQIAAEMIVDQYRDNDNDEKIIAGIVKAANAIRTKVKVFVSYKKKYELDTKKIVAALRALAGPKLDIWYAPDIAIGEDWMHLCLNE